MGRKKPTYVIVPFTPFMRGRKILDVLITSFMLQFSKKL